MRYLLFVLSVAFGFAAEAQQVTARVEPKVVRPGQPFLLTVTVSSDSNATAEQPELPDLTNFQLRNASTSSEIRSVFNNGKFQVSRSQVFNYEIVATQEGTFTIPPINVVVNGQSQQTEALTVQVNPGAPPSGGGGGADEEEEVGDMDDMFQQLLKRRLEMLKRGSPGGRGGTGGIVSPADLNDALCRGRS